MNMIAEESGVAGNFGLLAKDYGSGSRFRV